MSRHRVSCINKRGGHFNPHERISHIGGVNENGTRWKLTEDEASENSVLLVKLFDNLDLDIAHLFLCLYLQ
ncbi:MAG: hypothetical protein ACXVAY_03055 [Mucilaginibacter sp.]